jgi:peptidoglycan hydrolase-like protein with peptidoglycan-binding domain
MFKKLALSAMIVLILISPLNSSAQTTSSVLAQIDVLLKQISQLQVQLAALRGQPTNFTTGISSCFDLDNALVLGSTDSTTNGEVSKLQQFLIASGVYPEAFITGYYGTLTAQAVVRWQKAHGMDYVTLTSGVGPTTKEKMKCGSQTGATVKWDIGTKIDENFSDAVVTLSLPTGVVKTTHVNVRNDCKELNQQNMTDEYFTSVNGGSVFEKESNVIKPGLACLSGHDFAWYGVFSEDGKYYVKQIGEDASGLGREAWKIVGQIHLPPVISAITPASAPVGTPIVINGSGFLGFEADKYFWVKNSKGTKGVLYGEHDGSETSARATLPTQLCQVDVTYSGKDCPAYLDFIPGTYVIEASGWGGTSNSVNFTVTDR